MDEGEELVAIFLELVEACVGTCVFRAQVIESIYYAGARCGSDTDVVGFFNATETGDTG